MTSARQTAEFLAYAAWHRCIDADWVAGEVTTLLEKETFHGSSSLIDDLEIVRDIVRRRWWHEIAHSNREAAEVMICRAFEIYQPNDLDNAAYHDLATLSPKVYLDKVASAHLTTFAEAGLVLDDPPKVLLVDRYPPPYDRLTGSALAPDKTDRDRYGFQNAIYMRAEKYSPVIASLTIAHEFAHFFINDEGELARGLEEGIADFYAYFVVAPRSLSRNILSNHYSTRRISYGRTKQRFHLYSDYMRRAYWLWRSHGLSFLKDTLRAGRRGIKLVEDQLNDAAGMPLHMDPWMPDTLVVAAIADELSLLAMENEVYSPLALLYCVHNVYPEIPKIAPELTAKVRSELEERTFALLMGDDGVVEFEDLATPAKCRWARFDPYG